MPRKPKIEKKTITVVVNGSPVAVILHPPTKTRKSWYAYWAGLVTSKSTGHHNLDDAILAAENMVKNGGKRADLRDTVVSDEEFEAVQRAHFSRMTDAAAKNRADKTLVECLNAITAFKAITGLDPIAAATPDDCSRFQRKALQKPKNWRRQSSPSKITGECIRPNTVLKWSRQLQAAFNRVNRLAGKKCVRGVVDDKKLLAANPWDQFTWINGTARPIRQFTNDELLSLLTYFETVWSGVPVGAVAAKVFLWSACRKQEVASLTWDALRLVGDEIHFEVVGKWGVERWFRLPEAVYRELLAFRTTSPFVFAAYTDQIHQVYADNRSRLNKIRDEFAPKNFGGWFYERVRQWSVTSAGGRAYVHHFRKTGLQHARRGEDINRQVAADARVGEAVMMSSYVKEADEELRAKSNRTFQRILASLPPEVACRYGQVASKPSDLESRLQAAIESKNWEQVGAISALLAQRRRPEVG